MYELTIELISADGARAEYRLVTMAEYEELFVKTKEFILDLSQRTCLTSFYVGKSENIDTREYQHYDVGYEKTVQIAYSSFSDRINAAEIYLITKFKKEKMPVNFDNENNGGGGNPKANKLYVSLRFFPHTIEELDDDDFKFDIIKL